MAPLSFPPSAVRLTTCKMEEEEEEEEPREREEEEGKHNHTMERREDRGAPWP